MNARAYNIRVFFYALFLEFGHSYSVLEYLIICSFRQDVFTAISWPCFAFKVRLKLYVASAKKGHRENRRCGCQGLRCLLFLPLFVYFLRWQHDCVVRFEV